MRLTESRNTRTEQLLVVPTESLTNREWLPGELLNGLEHRRPHWLFIESVDSICRDNADMQYMLIQISQNQLTYKPL